MKFTETHFDNTRDDYLKYWKVVRQWAQLKYGLSTSELEMLLFLRSEKYFCKDDYNRYERLMSWNTKRFKNLIANNWIGYHRPYKKGEDWAIYKLTPKAQGLLNNIYAKLSGQEFYEQEKFDTDFEYTDEVYKEYITKLNKPAREERRRRLSRE